MRIRATPSHFVHNRTPHPSSPLAFQRRLHANSTPGDPRPGERELGMSRFEASLPGINRVSKWVEPKED